VPPTGHPSQCPPPPCVLLLVVRRVPVRVRCCDVDQYTPEGGDQRNVLKRGELGANQTQGGTRGDRKSIHSPVYTEGVTSTGQARLLGTSCQYLGQTASRRTGGPQALCPWEARASEARCTWAAHARRQAQKQSLESERNGGGGGGKNNRIK
jgi:hypothetical protein